MAVGEEIMYKHQILLTSSYSTGARICLHFTDPSKEELSGIVREIGMAYDGKNVPFSIHSIMTDSKDWASVVKTDPYFSDVTVMDSVDQFISLIQKDRYLIGLDVAEYILSTEPCTHARLEKLTYMCYADYMCQYGQKLFSDDIIAFSHGPVVESVYERYSGRIDPDTYIDDDRQCDKCEMMPAMSRIMISEDGPLKVESIDRTLKHFSGFTTEELIQLTHKERTPWSVTEKIAPRTRIEDSDIKSYHKNETDL